MRKNITKRAVDALRSRDGRDVYIWDSGPGAVTGFGIRTRGGKKTYVLKYSLGCRGRARKLAIGEHGSPWTAETAREEAKRLQGAIAKGEDPAAVRAAGREMPTLEDFAATYITKYAELHKRPRSVEQDRGLLARAGVADVRKPKARRPSKEDRDVQTAAKIALEPIARLRIDKVQRSDVAALHFKRRYAPTDANRLLAVLSKMFSLAEVWGLRAPGSNPCKNIPRYREDRRERFLSEAELARLGGVLREAEAENRKRAKSEKGAKKADKDEKRPLTVDPFAIAAVRLLVLTGARLSEILTAKWDLVDLETGVLRVPLPKEGKPKNIRLAPPALSVLKALPRLEENPYVIAGKLPKSHLTDLEKPWQRIREAAGLEGVRLHDLRHSWASVAAKGGASLVVIGSVLGHRQPATTARYAHLSDDPRRALADSTTATIASALEHGEGERPDNVVELNRGGR